MDRRELHNTQGYAEELARESKEEIDVSKEYIKEGDALIRMPYRKIKKVTFTNIKKEELKDIPHAARLQYRLLTNDAIIKAKVHYQKELIEIYYNPKSSENKSTQPKMSLDEIIKILNENSVHPEKDAIKEEIVDYKKTLFDRAFNAKQIRHAKPYSW